MARPFGRGMPRRKGERERHVAVPDEDERPRRHLERGDGALGGQNVVPDRVERASVVERRLLESGRGLERLEVDARLALEDQRRPARRGSCLMREFIEIDAAEDAQIVVPDEAESRTLGDERAAAVGPGSVTDQVAEAPEGVGPVTLDRGEDGLERVEITVDVGDDGDAHRGAATLPRGVTLVAALSWLLAGFFLWRTEVPDLDLSALDARTYFTAGELERIESFREVARWLWAASTAVQLAVLALLSWKARSLARLVRGRLRTGIALGLVGVTLVWLATLPIGLAGHWWRRRHGLSEQGYPAWLGDEAIALAVVAVLVAIAAVGAVFLAGRLGRRWWIAGGLGLSACALLFVLLQPLVVQPLSSDFRPVGDRHLAAEIGVLGERLGVTVEAVEVADASRRTTAANAYVAGIGPTRRVVLYDTLFDGSFTRGEILAISAHELAHVARRHLLKGVAWFALIAVPGLFVVAALAERKAPGGLRDPALVPLGLLLASCIFLATLPLQNAVSRRYEVEADWLALQATQNPETSIRLDRTLALSGLVDPTPPAWSRILLGTHPTVLQRIGAAKAFAERTSGRTGPTRTSFDNGRRAP